MRKVICERCGDEVGIFGLARHRGSLPCTAAMHRRDAESRGLERIFGPLTRPILGALNVEAESVSDTYVAGYTGRRAMITSHWYAPRNDVQRVRSVVKHAEATGRSRELQHLINWLRGRGAKTDSDAFWLSLIVEPGIGSRGFSGWPTSAFQGGIIR
jgi:hypothetical protein